MTFTKLGVLCRHQKPQCHASLEIAPQQKESKAFGRTTWVCRILFSKCDLTYKSRDDNYIRRLKNRSGAD